MPQTKPSPALALAAELCGATAVGAGWGYLILNLFLVLSVADAMVAALAASFTMCSTNWRTGGQYSTSAAVVWAIQCGRMHLWKACQAVQHKQGAMIKLASFVCVHACANAGCHASTRMSGSCNADMVPPNLVAWVTRNAMFFSVLLFCFVLLFCSVCVLLFDLKEIMDWVLYEAVVIVRI